MANFFICFTFIFVPCFVICSIKIRFCFLGFVHFFNGLSNFEPFESLIEDLGGVAVFFVQMHCCFDCGLLCTMWWRIGLFLFDRCGEGVFFFSFGVVGRMVLMTHNPFCKFVVLFMRFFLNCSAFCLVVIRIILCRKAIFP